MATEEQSRRRKVLSDEELGRLIALMKGADSVELKATVPAADQRSAVDALGLDPIEAQIRQVFFFDTPELALDAKGLVVRARRVQGGTATPVLTTEGHFYARRFANGVVCPGLRAGSLRFTG